MGNLEALRKFVKDQMCDLCIDLDIPTHKVGPVINKRIGYFDDFINSRKASTDLDILKAVFDDIGVEYREKVVEDGKAYDYGSEAFETDKSIEIEAGIGYMYFYCELFFKDGKYKGHGCWE